MSFLTEVKGFTPIIDALAQETSLTTAAVYGVVWRYCQMDDRICRASVETIAERIGVSRKTAERHLTILVDLGYLIDTTPNRKNAPHIYKDAGRIKVIGLVEARSDKMTDRDVDKSECPTSVRQNDSPRSDKMSHEESIKESIQERTSDSGGEKEEQERSRLQEKFGSDPLEGIFKAAQSGIGNGTDRPPGWRDVTDAELAVCKRVAELWNGGVLSPFGTDIEEAAAGANYLLSLHDGNARETIRTIDAYYHDDGQKLRISNPYSLRKIIPGFLANRDGGDFQYRDGKRVLKIE